MVGAILLGYFLNILARETTAFLLFDMVESPDYVHYITGHTARWCSNKW